MGEVRVKWLEVISVIEALVIRIGGLILIMLFIAQAIAQGWHGLVKTIISP
jgi:hypothetical protein